LFCFFDWSEHPRIEFDHASTYRDMGLLTALVLRVLHFCYALLSLVRSLWRRQTRPSPQPLCAPRRRVPENLALVFVGDTNIPRNVVEKTILQSCLNAVEWCRTLGISKLTIYEEHGMDRLNWSQGVAYFLFRFGPRIGISNPRSKIRPKSRNTLKQY